MTPRLNPSDENPELMQAVVDLEMKVRAAGLEPGLIELVKTRASQINGCAYCIHMHTRDARAHGETEERLYLLDAWRESSLYSDRERAALAWTEAVTRLAETGAPDGEFAAVRAQFSERETVALTVLVGMINLWNRLGVGFRLVHPTAADSAAA